MPKICRKGLTLDCRAHFHAHRLCKFPAIACFAGDAPPEGGLLLPQARLLEQGQGPPSLLTHLKHTLPCLKGQGRELLLLKPALPAGKIPISNSRL